MVEIGRPQNVVRRSTAPTQADYRAYLLNNLHNYQYRPRAPIHDMMTAPNNLFQTMGDSKEALLLKIMDNIYHYGRAHWTWQASTSPGAMKTFDPASQEAVSKLTLGTTGRGLLDGTVTAGACGAFASALKGMAKQIFNIDTEAQNVEGSTSITGAFITLTGSQVIDSAWCGNVWLDTHRQLSFNQISNRTIAAFKFTDHYFCNYQGTIYDVTCNKTFAGTDSMIWCKLSEQRQLLPNYPRSRIVYTNTVVTKCALSPAKYLVNFGTESSIQNGFANLVFTDRDSIPAADMAIMDTWSSR
jgi:hypothetical protein